MLLSLFLGAALSFAPKTVDHAFGDRPHALVIVDTADGTVYRSDAAATAEKLAPCSTFKIWNSAIGLETGIIPDADAPFWKWDGQKRGIEAWNQDQTLRTAFAVSCVPAYQALARKIGPERMAEWLNRIGYGDRNISSGIDVFWLPSPGRKAILISPDEQAALLVRLVKGDLPFSAHTLSVLKEVMLVKKTERGILYGKTGSSSMGGDPKAIGWFVGYLESGGRTYVFAALIKGLDVLGKDARAAIEQLFTEKGLL